MTEVLMEASLPIATLLIVSLSGSVGSALKSQADALSDKNRLQSILLKWHDAMANVQALSCQFEWISKDNVYQSTQTSDGTFKFLKPDCTSLEIRKHGAKSYDIKLMYNGKRIWTYNPSQREICGFDKDDKTLSITSGWVYQWLFKPFEDKYRVLFHGELANLTEGYELKLVGENEWYFFVLLTPRDRSHAAAFTRARLTLRKENHLPRQLWFEEPNGNETIWDFLQVDAAARLTRKDFTPIPPPGWHFSGPVSANSSQDQTRKSQ
jgi:outer membrane lipoprotein-sorting protein